MGGKPLKLTLVRALQAGDKYGVSEAKDAPKGSRKESRAVKGNGKFQLFHFLHQ